MTGRSPKRAQRWRLLAGLPVLLALASAMNGLQLKRVFSRPTGSIYGQPLCGDMDHDGASEMVIAWCLPPHWEVWKYQRFNQYPVVFADTGCYPPFPPGIEIGNFYPWDIGDVDDDSLTDLLGYHIYSDGESWRYVLGVQESPDPHSYPANLSWWGDLHPTATADQGPCYLADDLDGDSSKDILGSDAYSACNYVFENVGNNQNALVWTDTLPTGNCFTPGDFDLDQWTEFVMVEGSSAGKVTLYECHGDDAYSVTWRDTVRIPNGRDVFSGDDVDQDGKPEFFISFAWYDGWVADFHLLVWETVGDNAYERREITHIACNVGMGWDAYSRCGDVDADGVDEVVWTTATDVFIYKATGNDQYQLVWRWQNPTPSEVKIVRVNIYDLNRNGYNEVVLGGIFEGSSGHPGHAVYIYELETVQLVSPNGEYNLRAGDTCVVQWRVFTPPRCDSISLFLRTDTTWNMDTIATGILGTESTYTWVVPPTPVRLEPCRVVVFAYGPGWQYDESDSAFKIHPGIEEAQTAPVRDWALGVSPNPVRGNAKVRYDVPRHSHIAVGLYDVTGRLAYPLAAGVKQAGRYEVALGPRTGLTAGVYYLRLETLDKRLSRKVVLTAK